MGSTAWQLNDVTEHYLNQVRGAIPYGMDQTKMMLQMIRYFRPNPALIIDLGCGNGFMAKLLMQMYPYLKALLIDHSKPMLEKAKENMSPYSDRCQFIEADLQDSILDFVKDSSVDCIVSGYAIHHLPNQRKKQLYQEIFDLLRPEGVFVNVEHTASATKELEHLHDELFIDHLAINNTRERKSVAEDYYQRPDKEDNKLESVFKQVEWLNAIGFQHADCYFKWMELAVFGGVKPK